jgi:histidine triad (HIT) family protein
MILDIPTMELSHLMEVTKLLCVHYQQKLGADSVNLVVSNGPANHQKITHFHPHIVPRRVGDGLEFWGRRDQKLDAELERIRKKILVSLFI